MNADGGDGIHELVDAFADGELPPDEAQKFREHLAGCAQCQAELRDIMMLAAVTQTHAAALGAGGATPSKAKVAQPAPVISLASRRRRMIVMVTSAMAVAAAIVFGLRLVREQ